MPADPILTNDEVGSTSGEYVVVARRYRPQSFGELVGQQHVAEALAGAIHSHRVGHAYLFTGARGVGKTSAARIFAKALDCVDGPTDAPCNRCDICRSITAGDDVDVIEIDGASNRGIDDIRQLRQNVNVRPSRARFKIYIIDEVHMLSRDAFNALLKTLEEPPEHVKFIFCTTEPEKIPITILSRCQRFDFAGIETGTIAERLRQITAAEGVTIDAEAIDLIARRAAGSMRDSQSLLEQILSGGGRHVGVADVQRLLGIAADSRLAAMVEHLGARNAAGALGELDAAVQQGVDVGQLLDQLLGHLRDLMTAAVGCPPSAFLYVAPGRAEEAAATARQIGIHTLLAMLQVIEQAAGRLKQSTHGRTVVEMALVRVCCLEELDDVATLVERLSGSEPGDGGKSSPPATSRQMAPPPRTSASAPPAAPAVKKNIEPAGDLSRRSVDEVTAGEPIATRQREAATMPLPPDSHAATTSRPAPPPTSATPTAVSEARPANVAPLSDDELMSVWTKVCDEMGDLLASNAGRCVRVASTSPHRLVASFSKKYNLSKTFCERPDQVSRLEAVVGEALGRTVKIEFVLVDEPTTAAGGPKPKPGPAPHEKLREKMQQPFLRKALELFDARALRLEEE